MKPMLLTDCQDPEALLRDPEWIMQEKLDGDRMIIRKRGSTVRSWSRNGERAVPDEVLAVALLSDYDWTVDGELMPGNEFVWFAFIDSNADLQKVGVPMFRQVLTEFDEDRKFQLFAQIRDRGGEGVVFKKITYTHIPGGRSTEWQRWKFYESDDFTVGEVNLSKCSFEVWKDGHCYGRVACGMNRLPHTGDTVRVRYDRITEKGKLLRAKLHR